MIDIVFTDSVEEGYPITGIIRITPNAEAEIVVAGSSLVGLCFDDRGNMIVASNREIFKVQLGIEGFWPF